MEQQGVFNQIFFPQQKLPTVKKNPEWFKKNVDAAENMLYNRGLNDRDKQKEMESNDDIYNGIANPQDYETLFNPMDFDTDSFPSQVKNYPICAPKIDLLVGEEYLRKDEFGVRSVSESAVSEKQEQQRDMIMELVQQELVSQAFDEEDAQKKIQRLGKYLKYNWKDLNELTASRLLHYIYKEQNLKKQFNEGMMHLLLFGRELYRIDEVAGDVVVEAADPRTVFPLGFKNNFNIEDSDIIVQVQYLPIGKVIDEFYEYLSKEDIAYLEGGVCESDKGSVLNYSYVNPRMYYPYVDEGGTERLIDVEDAGFSNGFVGPFDHNGNVRVVRVRWRGRRRIGKLSFFDENGDQQEKWVSENYKPDRDLGETVSWKWVNEAYEGTKLAGQIYVKMQPRKVQIRRLNNKSKCDLGYVGTDCGTSLMSRMKPFQFAYNIYMRRLELLVARYGGPIVEVDMSKIPSDWELDKWMYYLHILGYMMTDPFNEGKKGAAQGKLAGTFNTTNKAISPEIGSMLQQYIGMLTYIEQQLGTIAGVTKQREGQVDNRETVGGVERAVTQSSHITEKWFILHDDTKSRVLQACIDVAKQAYKGKNLKAEFILDDMSRTVLDVNGDNLSYEEFDVFATSSSEDMKVRQAVESLAQVMIQNGSRTSVLTRVLRSESIAEMVNLLEEEEDAREQKEQEAQQQQLESNERVNEAVLADKDEERKLKKYEIDKNYEVALLQLLSKTDEGDGKEDLLAKMKQHEDKIKLEYDKLKEAERHNKAMESKKTNTSK